MRLLPALILLCCAAPAAAQTVFDHAAGLYGSASDPAQSCAANPHQLSFSANPPHAFLRWAKPRLDPALGEWSDQARYDLLDFADNSLTLRREGDPSRTETGQRPIWIMRLTANPAGYCWGRSDWSPVRCVDHALRCDDTPPTS